MTLIDLPIDEYIGRQVKQERLRKHMTQADLADAIGISMMGLSFLERGLRGWKVRTLAQVQEILGIEIDIKL